MVVMVVMVVVVVVVVMVRTVCNAHVSIHVCACVHLIPMGWCQCANPFGWTVQPASRCKPHHPDCEARPPPPLGLRTQGEAIFPIASALGALDLDTHELGYRPVSRTRLPQLPLQSRRLSAAAAYRLPTFYPLQARPRGENAW